MLTKRQEELKEMNRILHEELEKEKENASLFISKYYSLEKEMNETKKDLQEQEKTVCVLQQKLNENEELSAKQTEVLIAVYFFTLVGV